MALSVLARYRVSSIQPKIVITLIRSLYLYLFITPLESDFALISILPLELGKCFTVRYGICYTVNVTDVHINVINDFKLG